MTREEIRAAAWREFLAGAEGQLGYWSDEEGEFGADAEAVMAEQRNILDELKQMSGAPDPMIGGLALAAGSAKDRLEGVLAALCPGTHGKHVYVQHRDGKPPWCNSCRYTEWGVKI
jgi:hypothetical protein